MGYEGYLGSCIIARLIQPVIKPKLLGALDFDMDTRQADDVWRVLPSLVLDSSLCRISMLA